MAQLNRIFPAVLLALGSFVGGGALGQTAGASHAAEPVRAPARAAAPVQPETAPPGGTASGDAADEAASFPVLAISSVEVMRSAHPPTTDVVLVDGLASSDGWEGGELVPLRHTPSADGVLDLVFVAHAPMESATPAHYAPIQATLVLTEGHPFTAVRVRSASNAVAVKGFPGYAQAAKAPAAACDPCIGKVLVAKGAAAPSGVPASDIVREESLPPLTRILRPEDGISDTGPNPNRLTIIVGESGRIVDAAWE